MTACHIQKLERIFRDKFDETIMPRTGMPEDKCLQAGFAEWNRWLRDNRIHSRHYADNQTYEGFVQVWDPTGFQLLFVPLEIADKALALGFLP